MQLKKAMVSRDGHSNGCPANESKIPGAQDLVFVTTRASNAGTCVNSESKNAEARGHGSLFTWSSRTEAVGNRRSSGYHAAIWEVRKENKPVLPNRWSSLGELWSFTTVIGVNASWISARAAGRDD